MKKKEKTSQGKKKTSQPPARRKLAIWVFLTFFACAWMFVLGIFVGRGTVPVQFDIEKLRQELADLKKTVIEKELNQYQIESGTAKNKTEMEFYEKLKNNSDEDQPAADKTIQKRKPLPKKEGSGKTKTGSIKKTATVPKDKTADLSKAAEENNKNYTLQVAALKDSSAADKLVANLKKRGYPAYSSIGKIPGKGIWYRVRVGYFKNRTEAGHTLNRLNKDHLKAIIVQR